MVRLLRRLAAGGPVTASASAPSRRGHEAILRGLITFEERPGEPAVYRLTDAGRAVFARCTGKGW